MDKFKYKIVKCRYKDSFNPAKEQDLVAEKLNLRDGILHLIREQMVSNAPELAAVFAVSVTDSLQQKASL